MNCMICNKNIDSADMLKCVGCKAGFHYRCMDITTTVYKKEQAQMKRNFKCDSCINVTQRVRVTDETPVRGAVANLFNQYEEITTKSSTLLPMKESNLVSNLLETVNSTIIERLTAFEAKILDEIRTTVKDLVLENNKLKQDLKESNQKCISYKLDITKLETEALKLRQHISNYAVFANGQDQCQVETPMPKSLNTPSPSASDIPCNGNDRDTQPVTYATGVSYAMMATKTVKSNGTGVIENNNHTWKEVNYKKNPKKRGGNTSIVSIKAVERKKYLHVWRFEKHTTEENLKEYIEYVLGKDCEIEIQKLKAKNERNYASFKIGASEKYFDIQMCGR